MKGIIICISLILCGCNSGAKVLIIGDSVSLGYYQFLQTSTFYSIEHATQCKYSPYISVNKIENSEGSSHQAACINYWLSNTRYDVVYFNAGIWDANICGSNQANNLSDYLNNLQTEIDSIREHGATPIFATTTPVPMPNYSCTDELLIEKYNVAAKEMMESQGIYIDDLYSLMANHGDLHKSPNNVHWTNKAYKLMAESVIESINSSDYNQM